MPVKIRPELQALRAAAKAPRDGYFSVLDELITQLPDRPISVDELRQRLKPGRILKREDMNFPLKQEEIDYALEPVLKDLPSLGRKTLDSAEAEDLLANRIRPERLKHFVRQRRPEFEMDDVHNEAEYSRYTTQGPNRVSNHVPANANDEVDHFDEDYFATTTDSPNFGKHSGHYNDGTISFSRGSRHELPEGGVLRLIDEIQNDRANDARKHAHVFKEDREDGPFVEGPLRGWRKPEDQAYLDQVAREHPDVHDFPGWNDDVRGQSVPDAPFKTPQEYGRLEIKNQLLDALAADDAALGITPASGPASWFPGTGAKDTTYDKVYPGELRKIANQYGAPFEDINLSVKTSDPLNLNALAGTDIVDFIQNADWDHGVAPDAYRSLLGDLSNQYRSPRGYDPRSGHRDALDEAAEALDTVEEAEAHARIDSNGKLHPEDEANLDSLRDDVGRAFSDLYDAVLEQKKIGTESEAFRSIPSMRLTPEVKDRISRIGLPLFTAAGAAMLSPEMAQESDMGVLDQPQGFAKGGMVGRASGALRGIREASERAAAGRGQERDWLRELALESEPRKPVGEAPHGGAGEYGAWAEGPAKAPQSRPNNFVERLPATRGTAERPVHPLRSRASDAQSLAKGYTSFADAMEMSPRRRQYFVDANKLKALNDNYGFSVGDRLIELQNQLLRDELAALDPSVGAIMARGPGDEVFLAGNDDELMRRAIERANDKLLTEGVHMDTPQGKRTISGVASLKYGAGDDLDAAERDLMARKAAGEYDRGDASEAIEVLEAPRYKAQGGSLRTMRDHLNNYAAGGGVSMAERYADAIEGEYEEGDEFLDEDDEYEYYASGGQVHGYLFGGLKKLGKRIGKVVKKVAKVGKFVAPILGKIPGIGTLAGGVIGGLSGLIADGNLKGALSGALSGASGGLSNGLLKGALTVGSSMLDSKKKPKGIAGQMLQGVQGAQGQAPASIGAIPDMQAMQQDAVATNAAAPTQLSMLQGSQQPRVQPGSNANGLLARIQQQQQQQPGAWQQQPYLPAPVV